MVKTFVVSTVGDFKKFPFCIHSTTAKCYDPITVQIVITVVLFTL